MPATIKSRMCGTCEYWSGNRTAVRGGVQCSNSGDRGICLHKTMSKTILHQANKPGCTKYIQWKEIK